MKEAVFKSLKQQKNIVGVPHCPRGKKQNMRVFCKPGDEEKNSATDYVKNSPCRQKPTLKKPNHNGPPRSIILISMWQKKTEVEGRRLTFDLQRNLKSCRKGGSAFRPLSPCWESTGTLERQAKNPRWKRRTSSEVEDLGWSSQHGRHGGRPLSRSGGFVGFHGNGPAGRAQTEQPDEQRRNSRNMRAAW